jgi:hypothetical protein
MELVVCPECEHPAEITWRTAAAATGGAVEHAKVQCLQRHWFFLPAERLETWRTTLAS